MSKDRKDLKMLSLFMMALGIGIPVFEILFNVVLNDDGAPMLFVGLACVLCVVSLVTGYLGTRAANTPRKNLQPFVYASGVSTVLGIAFTLFFCVQFGFGNTDYYLGALVAVFGVVGLSCAAKIRKRLDRR